MWENPTNKGPSKLWSVACPCPSLIFESLDLSEGSLLPDYFGDLNAMHEAELGLNDGEYLAFAERLIEMFPHDGEKYNNHFISAKAGARAEALGLALNLWEAGQ